MGATAKRRLFRSSDFIGTFAVHVDVSPCMFGPMVQLWCSFDTALNLYRLHHSCTKDCTHMATIVKRGPRWRAQVRRTGHSTLSKTFAARADAMAWARDIEGKIDKGQAVDPGRRITFAELMTAYREQLLASKGIGRSKAQALDKLMKLLRPRRLVELKTSAFLEFCKTRENEGAGPATILQDLTHIGTVLRHGGALTGAEHAVETCI